MGAYGRSPTGAEFYQFLIHQFTTKLDMTPGGLCTRWGSSRFARVHAQIEGGHAPESAFQGSLREVSWIETRADPRFYNENTEAGREALLTSRPRGHRQRHAGRNITDEVFYLRAAAAPGGCVAREGYKGGLVQPAAFYEPGFTGWPPVPGRGESQPVGHEAAADLRVGGPAVSRGPAPAITCRLRRFLMDREIPRLRKVNQLVARDHRLC